MKINDVIQALSPLACVHLDDENPNDLNLEIHEVSTDSRQIKENDLFFALVGENFNAHDFLDQVAEKKAVAAVISENYASQVVRLKLNLRLIVVEDTLKALGEFAKYWREQHINIPLIAITGSNGKTTVKEMIRYVFEDNHLPILVTEGNLNNDIGLPLMLLKFRPDQHQFMVLEMGMNHFGELEYLSKIAQPDIAVITNAQRAHVGHFKSVEDIARAKSEIFEGLKPDGMAVFSLNDPFCNLWMQLVRGHRMVFVDQSKSFDNLSILGEHNKYNAQIAYTIFKVLNVIPEPAVLYALESFRGVKGRLQRHYLSCGLTVIDDTYNANPDSMKGAIKTLSPLNGVKIMVIGDMKELGNQSELLHQEIGELCEQSPIDYVFTFGEASRSIESYCHADDINQLNSKLCELINRLLDENDKNLYNRNIYVLAKGSRSMQLERTVKWLCDNYK